MLAAAVPLVTAAIASVVNGVEAAVADAIDGDGDVEDEEDAMEGSNGETRCCCGR